MTTSQEEEGGLIGMARRVEETWKSSRLATKFEELEFRTSRGGIVALVVNSDMGYANRQIGSFIREVPPGKKSGKHIHNFEAIIHIIKGKGYTMLGDNRIDWKVGDTMSMPPHAAPSALQPRSERARKVLYGHHVAPHGQYWPAEVRATRVGGVNQASRAQRVSGVPGQMPVVERQREEGL